MRRGQLSHKSVLIVVIAGFFSLLSIFLDQQVIQKEDTTRNVDIEIQNKIEKVNELSSNSLSVLFLEERAQVMTNYYSFFSTIFYKILLNLETDPEFKKYFNEAADNYMKNFIATDAADIMYDLGAIRNDSRSMSFYYYEYGDKELEEKIKKLFLFKNPLEESLINKIVNRSSKKTDFSSKEIYTLYQSLFQMNKQFAISIKTLNDVSNYFDKEEEIIEKELDQIIQKGKKVKIFKNYFILSSILSQIISLMALLFLFRNIIKERR